MPRSGKDAILIGYKPCEARPRGPSDDINHSIVRKLITALFPFRRRLNPTTVVGSTLWEPVKCSMAEAEQQRQQPSTGEEEPLLGGVGDVCRYPSCMEA